MLGIDSHNPYRLFFSFSLAGVISGLLLFIFSYSGFSIFWHRELMITLFLLPAATGFIFTAAPRFLVATPAKDFEIWIAAGLYLFLFLSFVFQWTILFIVLKWLVLTWVAVFFSRRWWGRKTKNPYWPPFIMASFLSGLIGATIQLADKWYTLDPILVKLGYGLYFDAMFWILLFGIGIKFFPMLTGSVPPVYQQGKKSLLTKDQYESNTLWFSVSFLCLVSFVIQIVFSEMLGLWMRVMLVSFMAYEGWGLLENPLRKGFTTTFIKIFLWTIVVAHFLFPFYTSFIAHVYHVVFVAGFLAITLMVETRVLLSHEQLDIAAEQRSVWILSAFILFYIAMITRVTAVFVTDSYINHLQYASLAALIGVLMVLVQIGKSFFTKKINGST